MNIPLRLNAVTDPQPTLPSTPVEGTPTTREEARITQLANQTDQPLNPFCFHWHWRSRFRPFGGEEPAGDPSYVFHTEYVELPLGAAQITVQFDDLKATTGSITFIVHAFDGKQDVLRHFETTVALGELVERQGRITFSISAVPGYTHALLAHSYGEMDGECSALSVLLAHQRPLLLPETKAPPHQIAFRTTGQLVSSDPPSFAYPVSQACTAAQLNEPLFTAAAANQRRPGESELALWRRLMPRRILDHYGALREEACLLTLGTEDLGVIEALQGCRGQVVEMPRRAPPLRGRTVDIGHFPSEFYDHFDMIVSGIEPEDVGSVLIWSRLVMDSARCLRGGGIGIYTCKIRKLLDEHDTERSYAVTRIDLERLFLKLMAAKLDVAEIRYAADIDPIWSIAPKSIPFTIVISKTLA